MGAYFPKPVTRKNSTDAIGKFVKAGTCSMQGWRLTQEDAHSCCIDYDDNTSFFAVFDGHGSHEVATYAAQELPKFIKQTDAYKRGDIKQALIDGYLEFDAHLVKPEILKKLKEISLINISEKPKDKYGVEIDKSDDYDRETDVVIKKIQRRCKIRKCETSNEKINNDNEMSAQSDSSDESMDSATNKDETSHECTENKSENNVESSKTVNKPNSSEEVLDQTSLMETNSIKESLAESDDDDSYSERDDDDTRGHENKDVDNNDDDDGEKVQVDETADQEEIDKQPGYDSGCTAVVAILKGNDLYVANAGDSRCVLCRDDKALPLTYDHTPYSEIERKRIRKAGGFVNCDRVGYKYSVGGEEKSYVGLNLSRALGDHRYKKNTNFSLKQQMITASPDVRHIVLDPKRDTFMILACDGIWEDKSNKAVVRFINKRINSTEKLSKICEKLFDLCLAQMGHSYGCDNMTAVLVKFETSVSTNESN
ncbi:hypothetical protein PV327_003277 [Microctonus hyperodae]|uniref:protein-serine/threonine phosphatase n=1 Tax=Microctonus hyperodae TaxID=165561 RepID=A0AA39G5A5_MICHY|nr:hypothetical protein PV327_003277 [Microctonus hyperodae]